MDHYTHFCAEDFARDDFFILWVRSADLEAETFWQNWLETYPFKRGEVEAARQLVLMMRHLPEADVTDEEIDVLKRSVYDRIERVENRRTIFRGSFFRRHWWAVAATVAALVSGYLWFFLPSSEPAAWEYSGIVTEAAREYDLIEVENQSREVRLVNLPDSSSVLLRRGSKLTYPEHFHKEKREIYLSGEAFFEITKDPERPFYVFANDIVTRVVGTSFTIRAYPGDKQVSVAVKTGKVVVSSTRGHLSQRTGGAAPRETVLAPSQQAFFIGEKVSFAEPDPQPAARSDTENIETVSFEYDETPLRVIVDELMSAYAINIVYDETVLGDCPITASLGDVPLAEKLNLICKAVRAGYRTVEGDILIRGEGCD
ncbi:MAG: hypothetical protein ABS46_07420 [Cytophagaceae bacterium SCN 52-12]|nr:MAG: hypothetical protein ABS46_07420 [Cytophagaceae bacterium SCN 52-12]